MKMHPSVSLTVSDNHCFGCHSRSGRISTNYQGWHETTIETDRITDSLNTGWSREAAYLPGNRKMYTINWDWNVSIVIIPTN